MIQPKKVQRQSQIEDKVKQHQLDSRKEPVPQIDFYSKADASKLPRRSFLEEDKQNESPGSNGSNKLLTQFKQDISRKKQYAKHNYVSEDHYDKILGGLKKHSGGSSNSSQENQTQNNQGESNQDVLGVGHAPFKSDDESNQSDQASVNSSSQNEEEKKEKQQYQVLKESLRNLQQRANTTLANQQKLMLNNEGQDGQNNLAHNYSMSSGNEDGADGNILQDSNYDDNQGLSASGSDNNNSNSGSARGSFEKKLNIFGSPGAS